MKKHAFAALNLSLGVSGVAAFETYAGQQVRTKNSLSSSNYYYFFFQNTNPSLPLEQALARSSILFVWWPRSQYCLCGRALNLHEDNCRENGDANLT